MDMITDSDLLTPAQVAAELHVSKRTAIGGRGFAELPWVRINARVLRLRRRDLDAFLQSRQSAA